MELAPRLVQVLGFMANGLLSVVVVSSVVAGSFLSSPVPVKTHATRTATQSLEVIIYGTISDALWLSRSTWAVARGRWGLVSRVIDVTARHERHISLQQLFKPYRTYYYLNCK